MAELNANVFIIGAAKAGTTSLAHSLGSHPQIALSDPKEPNVLGDDHDLAWRTAAYGRCFSAGPQRYRLDASTVYSAANIRPGVPERMQEMAPDARIIYMVRHPLDRIESDWREIRSQTGVYVADDFSEAVVGSPQLLDASRYAFQLSRYEAVFGRDRILVQSFDDLRSDAGAVVRAATDFLGLEAHEPPAEQLHLNAGTSKLEEPEWLQRLRRRVPLSRYASKLGALRPLVQRGRNKLLAKVEVETVWSSAAFAHVEDVLVADLAELQSRWDVGHRWVISTSVRTI